MRKTFTSLLLLAALLPAGLLAQSADEARQAAETFLAKRSGHNVSLQAVTTKSTVNKVAAQGVSDVHLFNAEAAASPSSARPMAEMSWLDTPTAAPSTPRTCRRRCGNGSTPTARQ